MYFLVTKRVSSQLPAVENHKELNGKMHNVRINYAQNIWKINYN